MQLYRHHVFWIKAGRVGHLLEVDCDDMSRLEAFYGFDDKNDNHLSCLSLKN